MYKSDDPVPKYNEIKHQELTGHYEKVKIKEPFYFYVDKLESTEKGGEIVSKKELCKIGILTGDDCKHKKHDDDDDDKKKKHDDDDDKKKDKDF